MPHVESRDITFVHRNDDGQIIRVGGWGYALDPVQAYNTGDPDMFYNIKRGNIVGYIVDGSDLNHTTLALDAVGQFGLYIAVVAEANLPLEAALIQFNQQRLLEEVKQFKPA